MKTFFFVLILTLIVPFACGEEYGIILLDSMKVKKGSEDVYLTVRSESITSGKTFHQNANVGLFVTEAKTLSADNNDRYDFIGSNRVIWCGELYCKPVISFAIDAWDRDYWQDLTQKQAIAIAEKIIDKSFKEPNMLKAILIGIKNNMSSDDYLNSFASYYNQSKHFPTMKNGNFASRTITGTIKNGSFELLVTITFARCKDKKALLKYLKVRQIDNMNIQ